MLLAFRLRGSAAAEPLEWVTGTLPDGMWEEAYLAPLLATDADAYGLLSGSLPPGLALAGGAIAGTPSPGPGAPLWQTAAGSLGEAAQGGAFGAGVLASGAAAYLVSAGLLPWGVTLDLATGALTGPLAVVGGPEDDPGPPPVWITPPGSLGSLHEGEAAAITAAATDATLYAVVGGRFPWGLRLDRESGAISGPAANVGGGAWEPDIALTWTAPASPDLGSFAIGAATSVVQAVSAPGEFAVAAGLLPWGLTMNTATGAISGAISAETPPGTYAFTVSCRSGDGRGDGARDYTITIA